jgi:hypothetical protein
MAATMPDMTAALAAAKAKPNGTGHSNPKPSPIEPDPAVGDFLSAVAWANLDVKPEQRLLGDFITSSTRAFLVGATGIGKTMLIYAMVAGMASGKGFLHWTCDRPSKWLIVDGEMPTVLIKSRSADLLRRAGPLLIPPHNITIYGRDREDEFAAAFPSLGRMSPLNTEAGHQFVMDLIAAVGGVDGVAFDNVMSLAPGDQRDEQTRAGCIPLVEYIGRHGMAQLWGDHTGHNSARQYGSNTKSWRFDALGILTPLLEDNQPVDHLAFKLSFESPGKARRRTPDNWRDFAPQIVRLVDDEWSAEPTDRSADVGKGLSDRNAAMFDTIRATLARFGAPQKTEPDGKEHIALERDTVREHLVNASWYPEGQLSDEQKPSKAGLTTENNALTGLKRKKCIDFNREWVWRP